MATDKLRAYEYYQEKMIELSDIDHKEISNSKAKSILGCFFHFPSFWQTIIINDMIKSNFLKRKTQDVLEIKSE